MEREDKWTIHPLEITSDMIHCANFNSIWVGELLMVDARGTITSFGVPSIVLFDVIDFNHLSPAYSGLQ